MEGHSAMVCSLVVASGDQLANNPPTPESSPSPSDVDAKLASSRPRSLTSSSATPFTVWSASWDGSIRCWNWQTRECVRVLTHSSGQKESPPTQPIVALARVPQFGSIWSSSMNQLHVWTVATGQLTDRIQLDSVDGSSALLSAMSLCPSYNDTVWCAVGANALVYPARPLASASSPSSRFPLRKIVIGHRSRIQSMVYNEHHCTVWSGDGEGTLCVWDAASYLPLKIIDGAHVGPIHCLLLMSFLVNDQTVQEVWSGGKNRIIRAWDPESFLCLAELAADHTTPMAAAVGAPVSPSLSSSDGGSPSAGDKTSVAPMIKRSSGAASLATKLRRSSKASKPDSHFASFTSSSSSSSTASMLSSSETQRPGSVSTTTTSPSSRSASTASLTSSASSTGSSSAADYGLGLSMVSRNSAVYDLAAVGSGGRVWSAGDERIGIWSHAQASSPQLHIIGYKNGDKYVGEAGRMPELGTLVRHGQGELHGADGSRYVGHWKKDKRSGFGVLVHANRDRFYGYFRRDVKHGAGTLIHADGTVFQGVWKLGKRRGVGQLWLPNGDTVRGEWNGDEIVHAKYSKGQVSDVPECSLRLFEATLAAAKAKADHASTRRKRQPDLIPATKWHSFGQIVQQQLAQTIRDRFKGHAASSVGPGGDAKGRQPRSPGGGGGANAGAAAGASQLDSHALSVLLSDSTNPLGQLVADFVFYFKAAYHFSYGDVEQLMRNCIDDVHSFVASLHGICAPIFELNSGGCLKKSECVSTIRELVTAKCFRAAFELFRTVYQKKNTLIQVKIDSLRAITLAEIGVKQSFWLDWSDDESITDHSSITVTQQQEKEPEMAHGEAVAQTEPTGESTHPVYDETKHSPSHRQPYATAVNQLRQLSKFQTTGRKLACLVNVSNCILDQVDQFYTAKQRARRLERESQRQADPRTKQVRTDTPEIGNTDQVNDPCVSNDEHDADQPGLPDSGIIVEEDEDEDEGGDVVMGAEDKFPILSWILIQAGVPHIYSELAFIRAFADPTQLRDEAEYRLMELEMALEYVNTLDWNLVDETGVVVPLRSLETRVLNSFEDSILRFQRQQAFPPRSLWIAELLLMLGTRRSGALSPLRLPDSTFDFLAPGQWPPPEMSSASSQSQPESAAYFELGQAVLSVLGLALRRNKLLKPIEKPNRPVKHAFISVEIVHQYPQHIYTYMSHFLQSKSR